MGKPGILLASPVAVAFGPAGTITVGKLPGALWPQALSLRMFGSPVRSPVTVANYFCDA